MIQSFEQNLAFLKGVTPSKFMQTNRPERVPLSKGTACSESLKSRARVKILLQQCAKRCVSLFNIHRRTKRRCYNIFTDIESQAAIVPSEVLEKTTSSRQTTSQN